MSKEMLRSITRTIGFLGVLGIVGILAFKLTGDAQTTVVGGLMFALGSIITFYFKKEEEDK